MSPVDVPLQRCQVDDQASCPGRPRRAGGVVESMEQLEQEAGVLDIELSDAQPTFFLGHAGTLPSDEALGAAGVVAPRP